ncbi:MAG: hemolysin family protein [Lachnospiraceae bacterium]|nr:hemolysin family protein [Lachnospiraceae bacterium]
MTVTTALICIVLCVVMSGFFSASEMSYSSCNRVRIVNLAENKDRTAGIAKNILDNFDSALSAILVGNNLVNIAASSLGSLVAIWIAGDSYTWVSTLVLTVVVIIAGETVPKILAERNATRFALALARPVWLLMTLLRPVTFITGALVRFLTGLLPAEPDSDSDMGAEELRSIIETAEQEEVLDEDTSDLVSAAIDFQEVTAQEVMTARVDIVAVSVEDDPKTVRDVVYGASVSRIPVYGEDIDHIIGMMHINRYLKAETELEPGSGKYVDIKALIKPMTYVYKAMKLPAVLKVLRESRQQIAIVTDEYGGTKGIVSVEDVLEELVGEIWDESDTVEPDIVALPGDSYVVDGDMLLTDLASFMEWKEEKMEEFDSDTVGGWCIEMLCDFPEAGDSFTWEGVQFTVTEIDGRRVLKVRAERK